MDVAKQTMAEGPPGPFMGKSFLLAIDAHSKWGEVYEMPTTTTSKTIEVLHQLFAVFGLPSR